MERYNSYKDSGVKWLGEIPSHWNVLPGLAVFNENKEKNSDLSINTVLSLSYGKIVVKKDIDEGLVPAEYNTYQIVHPGYIIIRCTDLQNDKVSLRTGLVKNDGIITSAYLGLVTSKKYNSSYIHYFLHAWDITKEIYRHGNGLRQSLSWLDLRRLPILLPPPKEQSAIAAYLDTTTAKIDAAIAQQQKMIDLLNERKQIIINRAVTKGLNPNAKMKDSGVEWIGEVPEGWNLIPLKAIISFINGYAFDSNDFKDEGEVKVIRISNIADGTIDYEGIAFVHQNQTLCPYLTKEGDLLIAMSGATTGKVGFDNIGGAYVNQRVGIIRSDFQKWVYYWLNTSYFKEYIYLSALGSAQPNISSKGIKNFRILFPSNEEYERIVENLELLCQKVDNAIESCKKQISLLQERKQIIINEVVTGKVRVV